MVNMGTLALSALLTVLLRLQAEAFYVQIDAYGEECFFEQGITGATMVLSFEVTEGGFLDIDVDVTGPDDGVLLHQVRKTNGRYCFEAYQDGPYKFCFSNQMSTVTPKMVMFRIHVGQAPGINDEDGPLTKLEEIIRELGEAILAVKQEQEYMEVQEQIHWAISVQTNQRVVLWAFFEATVLLAVAFGQIYYLKSFFQGQRRV